MTLVTKHKAARAIATAGLAIVTLWSTAIILTGTGQSATKSIIVQSTTSTQNSGLYEHLLPAFKKASGMTAHVVAVGTGQAIKNAMNCDGDVLLVHAKSAEEKFVADGFGVKRFDLMYNDFVIVGPPSDPANINGTPRATDAFNKIMQAQALFVSRGDDSGTHKKEMALWQAANSDPVGASGTWYRELGAGMGATLNAAVEMQAYAMTDRATWISFKNKSDYVIHVSGDDALFNQYGVILVNSAHCKYAKKKQGQLLIDWLLSPDGQAAIAAYKLGGKQLFFPNAK